MCTNMIHLPGLVPPVSVPCMKCDACLKSKKVNFVGRCIAESRMTDHVWFVTLTYRDIVQNGGKRPPSGAVFFNYRHVQAYLRRLRSAGYPLRFHCVGERGTERQRAHWHLIIWWQGLPPPHYVGEPSKDVSKERLWCPRERANVNERRGRKAHKPLRLDWNCDQDYWEHGSSHYVKCNSGRIAYLAGYISEGQSASARSMKMPKRPEDRVVSHGSTVPLVGGKYFDHLAKLHVQQGLSMQDAAYSFPEELARNGQRFIYYMNRSARAYYVRRYLEYWLARPEASRHEPASMFILDELDRMAKIARAREETSVDDLERAVALIRENASVTARRNARPPFLCPRTGIRYGPHDTRAAVRWDERLLAFRYPPEPETGVETVFWSFDDAGQPAWSPALRSWRWGRQRRQELAGPGADAARLDREFDEEFPEMRPV